MVPDITTRRRTGSLPGVAAPRAVVMLEETAVANLVHMYTLARAGHWRDSSERERAVRAAGKRTLATGHRARVGRNSPQAVWPLIDSLDATCMLARGVTPREVATALGYASRKALRHRIGELHRMVDAQRERAEIERERIRAAQQERARDVSRTRSRTEEGGLFAALLGGQ